MNANGNGQYEINDKPVSKDDAFRALVGSHNRLESLLNSRGDVIELDGKPATVREFLKWMGPHINNLAAENAALKKTFGATITANDDGTYRIGTDAAGGLRVVDRKLEELAGLVGSDIANDQSQRVEGLTDQLKEMKKSVGVLATTVSLLSTRVDKLSRPWRAKIIHGEWESRVEIESAGMTKPSFVED